MKTAEMEVTLIDHMGMDLSVVNAARVSMHKQHDEMQEGDPRLIKYLSEHNHFTPFCHAFASFRIKAPIFVARQLVKHQVGLAWNEVSRRYVDEEPEFWFPKEWRGRPEGNIKQGSSQEAVQWFQFANGPEEIDPTVRAFLLDAVNLYNAMIDGGVAPEQARMILPLNHMTEWIWSGSLAAFARVCKLRLDPHAQEETRMIAALIAEHMATLFPVSWKELMK